MKMRARKKTKLTVLRESTAPKRELGKAAAKLLARIESAKTFAAGGKVMMDAGAAVINHGITSREANIITRAANPMIDRLKRRLVALHS